MKPGARRQAEGQRSEEHWERALKSVAGEVEVLERNAAVELRRDRAPELVRRQVERQDHVHLAELDREMPLQVA
uniref:Uncharacterized protein n=1 Tax=Setaria italica TaxID=4555 RepID=A0A0Q3PTC8_SETIT